MDSHQLAGEGQQEAGGANALGGQGEIQAAGGARRDAQRHALLRIPGGMAQDRQGLGSSGNAGKLRFHGQVPHQAVLREEAHHPGRSQGGTHSEVLHRSAGAGIAQQRHPLPRRDPQGAEIRREGGAAERQPGGSGGAAQEGKVPLRLLRRGRDQPVVLSGGRHRPGIARQAGGLLRAAAQRGDRPEMVRGGLSEEHHHHRPHRDRRGNGRQKGGGGVGHHQDQIQPAHAAAGAAVQGAAAAKESPAGGIPQGLRPELLQGLPGLHLRQSPGGAHQVQLPDVGLSQLSGAARDAADTLP